MAAAALPAQPTLAPASISRPRTAFVLSGGASLGPLEVGMLRALYEHGIAPDLLVGTSVGALNAAFVTSRAQSTATSAALASVWSNLQREDIFPVSVSALLGGLSGGRDHLVPDRGLRRIVRQHIELDDLADAPIPLHVVVFDMGAGREVLLSSGPALDSVVASASIPGVFPPVSISGRRLIDGGVVNNTPISQALALGAEQIYVLQTQDRSIRPTGHAPRSALDAAIYGARLLANSRVEADIARYSAEAELIVLPAPNPTRAQPTSFAQSRKLIFDAWAAARSMLARPDVGTELSLAGR